MITNRQRINYLLDILGEPFSEENKKCGCGDSVQVPIEVKSKREFIEEELMKSLPESKQVSTSFEEVLDNMTEDEIGGLLNQVNIELIDQHLQDLAIFIDVNREHPTTLHEIREWDKKHIHDFQ